MFIGIIRQFHEGMQAQVWDDGDVSAAFPVSNDVKQGSVLRRSPFSNRFAVRRSGAFFHVTTLVVSLKRRNVSSASASLHGMQYKQPQIDVKETDTRGAFTPELSTLNTTYIWTYCVWKTTRDCVGTKINQPNNQTEMELHRCAAYTMSLYISDIIYNFLPL